MPLWIPPTTDIQPDLTLTGWGAFEVLLPGIGHPTLHFVGYHVEDGEGRVSSPITGFDSSTRYGVSRSGRVYHLREHPGLGGGAQYVWARWLRIWDVAVLRDCSESFVQEGS